MGRHAAAVDVDDEALASEPARAGAHRADIDPVDDPVTVKKRAVTKKSPPQKTSAQKTSARKPSPHTQQKGSTA